MKIIYIITKSNFGGAQRYVLDLVLGAKKKGHSVMVVTGGKGTLVDKLQSENIPVTSLSYLKRDTSKVGNEIKAFKELSGILKKEKPDVIHLNSSKAGGLGAFAGRLAGVEKIIFTAHGWPFNEDRNIIIRALIWIFSWMTVILSDKTITVTKKDYKSGQKMPFVKKKIFLIQNGIEDFKIKNKDAARKDLWSEKMDGFWIGAIAELYNLNKGLDYLVKAFAKISKQNKKVSLVIVGEGQDRESLESLIKELDLSEKVRLTGFVDEARFCLTAFDIFALPSIKEGLPYVLLEAGLAGLPVIASNVGGVPDIIDSGENGLLAPPKNADILANRILELTENPSASRILGDNLRKKVLREFSLEKMTKETLDLYVAS